MIGRRDFIASAALLGVAAPLWMKLRPREAAPLPLDERWVGMSTLTTVTPEAVMPLTSTSDVFVPPRGRGFMKFSFDHPEPSVAFAGYVFGFNIFTDENTYGLDGTRIHVEMSDNRMQLNCDGFIWAGGQEKAKGTLAATFTRNGDAISWHATAEMGRPIKTVSTLIRGVPRGSLSFGNGAFFDPRDNEILAGYPFGAGDLHGPGAAQGMTSPVAVVQPAADVFIALSSRDTRVRPKKFYFQPGEHSYKVEAIYEHDGWRNDTRIQVPEWSLAKASTMEDAIAPHFEHIQRAYSIPSWDSRTDVPAWFRSTAMVTTLHGMHYTGYMFNDYAKMLETLRWMNTQIPGRNVLVFVSAWDGRYYWDYPNYVAPARMGGEAGFRRLVDEGHKMGFRIMPMFGMNSANRHQPAFAKVKDAVTTKIDGDTYNLNWVDWNNDRHQDGWLGYMNLGVDSWRKHMEARISDCITRYGVDAYFLDIAGGHVNDIHADMHEGTRRLVTGLRAKHPDVMCVGEMPYDALFGFIPVYHAGGASLVKPGWQRYSRFFQHLSLPAPGRGSTGVHEAGFGTFDDKTLMMRPESIPTLNVVDDTFSQHRDVMAEFIKRARTRAGI